MRATTGKLSRTVTMETALRGVSKKAAGLRKRQPGRCPEKPQVRGLDASRGARKTEG
jgi:hypothetical protein